MLRRDSSPNSRPRINFEPHRTKNPESFLNSPSSKKQQRGKGKRYGRLLFVLRSRDNSEGRSLHRMWHSAPRNAEAHSRASRRDWRPTTPPASQTFVFPRAQKRNAPAQKHRRLNRLRRVHESRSSDLPSASRPRVSRLRREQAPPVHPRNHA